MAEPGPIGVLYLRWADGACVCENDCLVGTPLQEPAHPFFLMHENCPPASITQSGLTTGKEVDGEVQLKKRYI